MAKELLEKFTDAEVDEQLLNTAFVNADKFEKTFENKEKKLDLSEVEDFIASNFKIRKNILTGFYEWNGRRMTPEDWNTIFITCKKAFDALTNPLFLSIVRSNKTPQVNPINDFLNNIKWDGKPRIRELAKTLNSCTGDLDYQELMLYRWLMGFMQNVYSNDACPLMLIIVGLKNTGKTWFFKHLLPSKLNEYFGTSQHDRDKDDDMLMTQKWLLLDDEYSGKSKQDSKK